MAVNGINTPKKVIFSTGNILSINDIKKKPTVNPTEELTDVITFTLKEHISDNQNGDELSSDMPKILSRNDDLHKTIAENGIDDLKIGLKVFLSNDGQSMLHDAIENALSKQLKIAQVDNIIIAFNGKQSEQMKDNLEEIKTVWKTLEKYVEENVVKELGIADVEEGTFRALHDWATVKPKIIQINLETCCVVPPTLQQFCKDNDIKLLTHSDSSDILPKQTIQEIFDAPMDLQWAVRFTVHIRCRGVLTTKGYVLSFIYM